MTALLTTNQTEAILHLKKYRVGALFMEPGTGKTRACLELVNSTNDIDLVLYIAPLRSIKPKGELPSIIDEVDKWGGFNVPVSYVGVESISQSDRIFLNVLNEVSNKRLFIIVDESIKIKNYNAKRTQRIINIGEKALYKLILNGTPATRDLLDYWAQFEFLSPKILGMSMTKFKNTFCKYTIVKKTINNRTFRKEFITGYENIDYLHELTRKYVYDCDLNLDITQNYYSFRYSLSCEEKDKYNEIKAFYLNDEMMEWRNDNIFFAMTQKMQHSYCCSKDKVRVLEQIFKKEDVSKTIIFCKYVSSRIFVQALYKDATVLMYQTSAMGLNLQDYNVTIYFDKIWDYHLRKQSGNRTFRTGQNEDCIYYDLDGEIGLDNLINNNVKKKVSMAEYIKKKTREDILKEL